MPTRPKKIPGHETPSERADANRRRLLGLPSKADEIEARRLAEAEADRLDDAQRAG